MHLPFPTIQSKNLYFRPFRTADAAHVFTLFSDKETMMFDGGETLHNMQEAYQFIKAYSTFYPGITAIRWAVEWRRDGRFLGSCGFHSIDYFHKRAEIGGELLKPYRGSGYAIEAMGHLIHFGFQSLGLNRLTAMISTRNKNAISLIEKSPFQFEGCLKQWERWGDHWEDLNVYRLLRKEWMMKSPYNAFNE